MIEWIKTLRSTKRGRALFKLMSYGIFMALTVVIILIGSSKNNHTSYKEDSSYESLLQVESKQALTYLEKQSRLYEEDYDFKYSVKGQIEAIFEGSYKDGVEEGLKETNKSVIHYSKENTLVYKHNLKEKQVYTELYTGLDEQLFDFKLLFSILNSSNSTIERTENNKIYNYKEVENYIIKVTTNELEITSIVIKNETIEYNFEFQYKERRS